MHEKLTTSTIVTIIIVVILAMFVVFYMLGKFLESAYMLRFKKPPLVHFYLFRKRLAPYAVYILDADFRFYRELSEAHKAYFQHRVSRFIKRYKFAGRDGLVVTDEMKIKIAATWVMLTFGLRKYLTDMFEVIVLYPDVYTSNVSESYHYAEFNPGVGAVVFSWPHFEAGLDFKANNVNLGLHEFAHVMHTGSTRSGFGAAGALYVDTYKKIMAYVHENLRDVVDANYFRQYAYTNDHEFIAVALEYFFEEPEAFQQRLPQLYDMVSTMVNHRRAA